MVPSYAALSFDPDLSTFWAQHLKVVHDATPQALLDDKPQYGLVCEFPVGKVRQIGFIVRASPTGTNPIECAHVSVDWPPASIPPQREQPPPALRKTLRDELVEEFSWVYGEPPTTPPTGA